MEALIDKYIELRDAEARIKETMKTKIALLRASMEKIEAFILEEFQKQGIESARTEAGTAYKSTLTSATVADWDATLEWVKAQEAWDFLEKRVNKTVVQVYKESHNDLPPGVNWREETTINIRRSK